MRWRTVVCLTQFATFVASKDTSKQPASHCKKRSSKVNLFTTSTINSLTDEVKKPSPHQQARGTRDSWCRMAEPIPPSVQSSSYTHSWLYHHMCLRTDGQWRTWMGDTEADAGCALFLLPFVAKGVVYIAGPVWPPIRPPARTTTG